jgi:transcriptional regulator with GAF, ATPase, and Fis domain
VALPAVGPKPPGEEGEILPGLFTWDAQFISLLARLPAMAATNLPVLILGEPGTGKELVAQALWALSPRQHQPLARLNCAALSPELATSELFGHVQGAFTGAARNRLGRFRLAHGGTLFLDEVGDLPLSVQPRLLRALEQGEVEPVGGDRPLAVDVRLLAATNQDLPQLIAAGRFRQDVYDRLAVLVLHLPPLRERRNDALHLARWFVREEGSRYGRQDLRLSAAAERRLQEHHWPGNVRELKNLIIRSVILSRGSVIQASDLVFAPPPGRPAPVPGAPVMSATPRPVREELAELFRETGGNVSALARRLKVSSRTVYRWLKALDLNPNLMRAAGWAAGSGVAWGRGPEDQGSCSLPPTPVPTPLSGGWKGG